MANVNSKGQTHDQLQAECWKLGLRLYHPFLDQRLFCVPNDMHAGNVARWKQYEALGVTPGVWDMQLLWFGVSGFKTIDCKHEPTIIPATHWFEFKVGKDDLKPKQELFMNRMAKLGHYFHIISEEDQFISRLEIIIKPTLGIAKQIWKEELEIGKTHRTKKP